MATSYNDIFWELAHVNNALTNLLKVHAQTRCTFVAVKIHELRKERDALMEKLGESR
jgi:hypothetical protein